MLPYQRPRFFYDPDDILSPDNKKLYADNKKNKELNKDKKFLRLPKNHKNNNNTNCNIKLKRE